MQTNRCHFCSTPIYPGEKRCGITIRIFPDMEEDFLWEGSCPEEDPCPREEICSGECLSGACEWEEGEVEEEFFQEARLVLCKSCQDQFLSNPSMRESLFFLRREPHDKNVH